MPEQALGYSSSGHHAGILLPCAMHSNLQSPSNLAELIQAMSACIPEAATASTIAIAGTKSPVTRQIGSGTLLAVADSRFVLTAAHVLREAARHEMTVGFSSGQDGAFTAATGTWMVTIGSNPDSTDDKHDVALYELNDREKSRLTRATFVRIGDASFASDLSNGYFVVTGYPGMWSTVLEGDEKTMRSKLLQYSACSFSGSSSALDGFDAANHFLLDGTQSEVFDPAGEPIKFRTRTGAAALIPDDLGGISGASVWMIGDLTTPVRSWTKDASRIVGIETGVFRKRKAIKATRWNAVTTLLYNAYPHTRPAIEIYAR